MSIIWGIVYYLYITDNSEKIGIRDNYIYIVDKNDNTRKVPIETLESISIFGNAQLTTQCVQCCLKKGIPLSYYSKGGQYFGKLQSTGHVNVARQRKQAALYNTEFAIALAKKIISSKMHNQIVVLRRYANSRGKNVDSDINKIKLSIGKIEACNTISQIMGYEGNAAKIYFDVLSTLIEPEFQFEGRSRRPPKDEFNSMLSLGYSIILNEIYGKIEHKGLNPYFGFIHQDREKHPTLASDMLEEWRAVIVDSVVMNLINGHEMNKSHFYTEIDQPGIFLSKEGLKIFINKIEKRLGTSNHYLDYMDYAVSFRRALDLQVEALVRAIESENVEYYHPVWIR